MQVFSIGEKGSEVKKAVVKLKSPIPTSLRNYCSALLAEWSIGFRWALITVIQQAETG